MALVELGRLAEARAVGQRLLAPDPKHTVTVAARASPQHIGGRGALSPRAPAILSV